MDQATQDALDAAAFRRLMSHLHNRPDVQNIELMILADFCRNCLANWYREAAEARGLSMTTDDARLHIYGMPYETWKERYQKEATPEQMAAYDARRKRKGKT